VELLTLRYGDRYYPRTSKRKWIMAAASHSNVTHISPQRPRTQRSHWLARLLLAKPLNYFQWRLALLIPHVNLGYLRPLDPLRILLQIIWLLLVIPPAYRRPPFLQRMQRATGKANAWLLCHLSRYRLLHQTNNHQQLLQRVEQLAVHPFWRLAPVRFTLYAVASILILFIVTTPMSTLPQALFVLLLWGMAMIIGQFKGNLANLLLILLSAIASTRYLWWRAINTLNWDNMINLTLGIGLLAAEIYIWLVLILAFIQIAWPLRRPSAPLPDDKTLWPAVDVFIPTYNEPMKIVRPTVLATMNMDWPEDKLNIYLLDDGRRQEFKTFAEEVGIHYMARPDNRHAKAGNLNYALERTQSELITIFDCDHIPTRSFLQTNVGWFLKDPKLALLQTPHLFYSPDPFERNLDNFRRTPNENELFYGVIQEGNDFWNAAFFCGSCALLRRGPLEEIGGVATETLTEDAHTALRLHREGYNSAYLNIPQAAGLAPESLSAYVGQRIRWARGMIQILRIDNPLFGKGLSLGQRLCYFTAMLYFLTGIPRLVFLTAPLAFLILHVYIIHAPAQMILLYVLPHLLHSNLTNARLQGKYRYSFWAEVYESVLAWYIARATIVALFAPHKGSFNVTAKGGLIEQQHFDWEIARPSLVLTGLNVIGLLFGIWRLIENPANETAIVMLNIGWTFYNLVILGVTLSVATETRQTRNSHRIPARLPALLQLEDGRVLEAETLDLSEGGVALHLDVPADGLLNQKIEISIGKTPTILRCSARIVRSHEHQIGLLFDPLTLEDEARLIECIYGRADAWKDWVTDRPRDRPLRAMLDVLRTGLTGFHRVSYVLLRRMVSVYTQGHKFLSWVYSLLPRTPNHLQSRVDPP